MSKDKQKKTEKENEVNTEAEETVENTAEKNAEVTAEEKLASELAAAKEQYLRLAAEYDNYRKRSVKERENVFSDAKATVLTELLPVLDNFDRAFTVEDSSLEDFKKGVEMTHTQLLDALKKFGVESFGEQNDKFDPNFHNAVMHIDDESFEENVIAEVFQKGYKAGERVLRPAMVKVAN